MLIVTPVVVPAPPVDISFKADSESVLLIWIPAGEHVKYNVYRRTEGEEFGFMPANKIPISDGTFRDSFDISRTVHYHIRGLAAEGVWDEGPPSAEISVDPSNFVPSAPSDLQAVIREGGVQLIWKEPVEQWITGFRVYREVEKNQGYILIGETQTPAYFDRELIQGQRNYRVSAVGPFREGESAEVSATTDTGR